MDGCLSPQDLAQQRETNLKWVRGCVQALSSDALRPPPHLSTCPGSCMGLAFVNLPATRKAVEAKCRCREPAYMGQGAWELLPYCKMKGKKNKLLSVIQEHLPPRSGPGGEVSHQTKQLRVSESSWLVVTPSGWAAQALPHFGAVCEVSLQYCSLGICFR